MKKLEKNFPYLLCQHSDFGADNAAGCAERDGRSPAKLSGAAEEQAKADKKIAKVGKKRKMIHNFY